jgi:8-oxo-dGTP pyrophosphatase MutT (NUDIX family)
MASESFRQDRLYRGLVSIKGVVWYRGGVILLKNERDEWELPGGKLEIGETFAECLMREFREELGLRVEMGPVLDVGPHHRFADIIIAVFGCYPEPFSSLRLSSEHSAVGHFPLDQLPGLRLSSAYRRSIESWARDPRSGRLMQRSGPV